MLILDLLPSEVSMGTKQEIGLRGALQSMSHPEVLVHLAFHIQALSLVRLILIEILELLSEELGRVEGA